MNSLSTHKNRRRTLYEVLKQGATPTGSDFGCATVGGEEKTGCRLRRWRWVAWLIVLARRNVFVGKLIGGSGGMQSKHRPPDQRNIVASRRLEVCAFSPFINAAVASPITQGEKKKSLLFAPLGSRVACLPFHPPTLLLLCLQFLSSFSPHPLKGKSFLTSKWLFPPPPQFPFCGERRLVNKL